MASLVSPSPVDRVLRATANVKSRLGLVAVHIVLPLVAFASVLFLTHGQDRLVLGLVILTGWLLFAVYAVRSLSRAVATSDADQLNSR